MRPWGQGWPIDVDPESDELAITLTKLAIAVLRDAEPLIRIAERILQASRPEVADDQQPT